MPWSEHSSLCWESFPRSSLPIFPSALHEAGKEGLEKDCCSTNALKSTYCTLSHHWATCGEDLALLPRSWAGLGV